MSIEDFFESKTVRIGAVIGAVSLGYCMSEMITMNPQSRAFLWSKYQNLAYFTAIYLPMVSGLHFFMAYAAREGLMYNNVDVNKESHMIPPTTTSDNNSR